MGAKGTQLFAIGPDSAGPFVPLPRVRDVFALRKPKMGTWQVWARSGSKSTLLKRNCNTKSQAKIFKNSGCAVGGGLSAQLGGKRYLTFHFGLESAGFGA